MNKKIVKFIEVALLAVLFFLSRGIVFADVNLTLRDGANIVFSGPVTIPTNITSLNDSTGTAETVDPSSVLSVIQSASEQPNANFSISNLTYYASFTPPSLYLKCITDVSGEKCDNWQYTVNGSSPSEGMDKHILSDNDNVYLYFGPQYRVTLSSSNIMTDDILTVNAQKYDYQNDAWITRTGVTIGVTQPDPNNPFSPTEIKTAAVDANGQASFSSLPAGSYNIGIKEDFYYPTEVLTVTTPASISYGGGGGGMIITPQKAKPAFDIKKSLDFLVSQQKTDGSFGDDIYTDWVALALAPSADYQDQKTKLVNYLKNEKPSGMLLTDFERKSMALMALGVDPYNTNGENYINKIVANFDGKQFGDISEDNDDIFALIVLQNVGFTQTDKIIDNDVTFILSQQKTDGSWDESVDMTGAGIEALIFDNQNEQVKDALAKAEDYLKQNQKDTGGWNNISSTTWALEGIQALSLKPEDWVKISTVTGVNNISPLDYLASNQDTDGGIKESDIKNKIWETAYTTSVLSGKIWNQIMQKFEKSQEEITAKDTTTPKTQTEISGRKNTNTKKNRTQMIKNIASQITTTAVNSITNSPQEAIQLEKAKTSWFKNLLNKIFSIF